MHPLLKLPLTIIHLTTGLVLLTLPALSCAEKEGPIVVTIKPLYSLVAYLTDGIQEPVLLMKQMQSPHHYTMRPSERRLLSNASMIIWTGPQMETYLGKIIHQQDTSVITAMQADDLRILEKRKKHGHQHDEGDIDPHDSHIDPHIWLSTRNAIAISEYFSRQLIIADPDNRERYENNLQQLTDKIGQLSAEIKTGLQNNSQPFITYHDAYQYFEDENQLNYFDSVSFDEETGASLKHLRHIKASIKKEGIRCLLYQPPRPDIVDNLTGQTAIRAFALDPLGQIFKDDKEAWFEIMRETAQTFKQCLDN
jgi:zinc transport system substrate-binding protein